MSNLNIATKIEVVANQLPVHAYFDETIFEHELNTLFKQGPRYIGHELMVPEVGQYFALPSENEGRVLMHNANGIELLSNVCRHRQALMLNGRGSTQNIVCPLHRWTYDKEGHLLGAPHFKEKPCANLQRFPMDSWNGFLFEKSGRNVKEDLAQLASIPAIDFSSFVFDRTEIHECNYNWKTFIEVYLEDYHVEPFHPGLSGFVSCDDLNWEFGSWYSVQTVGIANQLARPGSPVYQKWHQALLNYTGNKTPEFGAIWMVYYPHMMIELYPHVLVVSWLIPRSPQHTTNIIEFYYPEDIALFEPEFIAAHQAAYLETMKEDDDIAQRMDAGRQVLLRRGVSEIGPYQSPMEDGMQHFHRFLRRELGKVF